MSNKITSKLYGLSRASGKCASTLNDINDILSFNFTKLIKRKCKNNTRKRVNKAINKLYK